MIIFKSAIVCICYIFCTVKDCNSTITSTEMNEPEHKRCCIDNISKSILIEEISGFIKSESNDIATLKI